MGYFRLKPECYLVMGQKRAVLHNLVEKKCIWLTEEAAAILSGAEKNAPIKENEQEFFRTLERLQKRHVRFLVRSVPWP